MTITDIQNKINALYGYTPSQGYLLQNPNLIEIALYAIAANVSSLNAIAIAYNTLMGTSFQNSDLIVQPEKAINGILAIASNTTSLSTLATAYNTLMGTAFDGSTIKSRPDLIRLGLLAERAGVTSLSAIISKINALMGWTPTTAQLLADVGLMVFGINAIRANASNLTAIATAYNALMGTAFDEQSVKSQPELLSLAVVAPLSIAPISNPSILSSSLGSIYDLGFTSGVFTPAPNSLLIAFVGIQARIPNIGITSISATGGAMQWAQELIAIAPSSRQADIYTTASAIFKAISGPSPSPMQIEINFARENGTGLDRDFNDQTILIIHQHFLKLIYKGIHFGQRVTTH